MSPTPANPELYERIKKQVYAEYKKPSAYRSGMLVKRYKEAGGTYIGSRPKSGLTQWFKEQWKDIGGNAPYPVYRPTKRVSKTTPLTVMEIDPKNLKEQIQRKQRIRGTANLPPFKKK